MAGRVAWLLLILPALARADDDALVGVGTADVPIGYVNVKDPWIDRLHQGVFNAVWRSAMRVDQWFGSTADENAYMQTSGSIAPSLLYDEFDGFQPRLRFQVDVPLPRVNERFHAFIGRVNRDEYVTERKPGSGAFPRQYGPVENDETLFGIRYREPRQGGHFEADAGLRIRSPLDPFVKGSWRFEHGTSESTLWSMRETAFWQNSEKFGVTSRFDVERIFADTCSRALRCRAPSRSAPRACAATAPSPPFAACRTGARCAPSCSPRARWTPTCRWAITA